MTLEAELVALAVDNGAVAAGICQAQYFGVEHSTLIAEKASGRSGPLHFTYENPQVAAEITRTYPWARSLLVMAVSYLEHTQAPGSKGPQIGRFATSNHYRLLEQPTTAAISRLNELGYRAELIADNNSHLDRAAAIHSGVGWRGRSTMVLTPGSGPWTLFGTVVTDAVLDATETMKRTCGTCTACLPACPTGALDSRGLDARRCLATWLQTGGSIPLWVRPQLGRRVYGCDDCLTSCPPGAPALRRHDVAEQDLDFEGLLSLEDVPLLDRFSWWYVPHRDPRVIRRNLLIAAGNSGDLGLAATIEQHLSHRSALIRGHAAWSLARLIGTAVGATLEVALAAETEPAVKRELLISLAMLEDPERYRQILTDDEYERTGTVRSQPEYAGVMSREPVTTAIRAIRKAGISYQPFLFDYDRHPGALGAAEALGVDLHQTVKTIVFETSEGKGVMVLMNGDHEVSTKTVARLLGVKSVKPAGADRARKWTGYEFGGTSPFGTREQLRLMAHSEIPDLERIYINAGSRGFLVAMNPAELIRTLQPEVADLAT